MFLLLIVYNLYNIYRERVNLFFELSLPATSIGLEGRSDARSRRSWGETPGLVARLAVTSARTSRLDRPTGSLLG